MAPFNPIACAKIGSQVSTLNAMSMSPAHNPQVSKHAAAYAHYLKPRVVELLTALGLDVEYERGVGDCLSYRDKTGQFVTVLDMVGGFGAGLLGHNHPEIIAAAEAVLSERRPILAQASIRAEAGALAMELAGAAKKVTGVDYIVTLANSGAEVVEAAIKHSSYVYRRRTQEFLRRQQQEMRRLDYIGGIDIDQVAGMDIVLTENQKALERPPVFLAVEGSFHGKLSGSVKLTHNKEFRLPWVDIGLEVEFIPREDQQSLLRAISKHSVTLQEMDFGRGSPQMREKRWSRIAALFVEPIQGEGGVNELSASYLQALRAAADTSGFALVEDEIQSGMGRTGHFLAAEPSGAFGDYILLSKALGGSLVKQAALLVRRDQYVHEFGYLHTSTFAEDDYSAAVARVALDLVMRDGGELMDRCRRIGEQLKARLREIQRRHPDVISDVRGRGLMIGVELAPLTHSASRLLQVLSEQKLLGFAVAGYLLHRHRVRIAPNSFGWQHDPTPAIGLLRGE